MDTAVENQKSVQNRSTRFPVTFSFIIQFFLLLVGYKILPEDELDAAGIKLDHYRNE